VPSLCQIELIDFGATREYSKRFMDDWLRLLRAAIDDDKAAMVEYSRKLKYLLGGESQEMVDAHVTSMSLLGGASPGPLRRISEFPAGTDAGFNRRQSRSARRPVASRTTLRSRPSLARCAVLALRTAPALA
jgi:hypothetical protein